jgi:arylsulfatase A-like enzyme
LFLLVDCMRADALGGRGVVTPTFDRLTSRGVHFTHAISSTSSTTPCVAAMLTGTYSPRHGVRAIGGQRLHPHVATLPELLRDAGYHTAAAVTGPLLPESGLDRGFVEYDARPATVYLSDAWGQALIERVARHELPEPWFLFLHLWELHTPRKVLPPYRGRRHGRNRYDRALASLDATLAPLLAAVGDDTVVLAHGDHGERLVESALAYRWYRLQRDLLGRARTEKREGHETDVYEELIRVPLVVVAPERLPAGVRVDQLVRQVDVMPTVLDLLDHPVPPNLDGVSLAPAAFAGAELELEAFIEACGRVHGSPRDRRHGWRTPRWKYVAAPLAPDIPAELYDLEHDPRERHNLAAAEPARVAELAARVAAVEATAEAPAALSDAEQEIVERRLRDLGYLE